MPGLYVILKYLTLPFALLYGLIIWVRNKLYDAGWSSSLRFSTPIINVGNLSVGGTGKTPHIAYLIELLQNNYHLATLSRGYKRRSKGFIIADNTSSAFNIGDEPMQYHITYPNISVCVGEDRIMAIPTLLQRRADIQAILMDDAFQHRSIQAGLNILITPINKLYTNDYILPFGRLREFKSGAKRAEIIIVSKCDKNINDKEKEKVINELKPLTHQKVYFSYLQYLPTYNLFTQQTISILNKYVIAVAGIANPTSMLNYIKSIVSNVHLLNYPDHHYFSERDLLEIKETYNNIQQENKIIVTTEKDATRLLLHQNYFEQNNITIAVLPIKVKFVGKDEHAFNEYIENWMEQFYPKPIINLITEENNGTQE
jgi:tetraacyldisaccharide 4'-kinase